MTTLTPRTAIPMSSARAPLPYMLAWLDSLWPADVDVALRSSHGIRVEEFSRNGDFVLRAELPGVDIDNDVDVSVNNGMLTIEATREEHIEEDQRSEFNYGRFHRSVLLPTGVTQENVAATYSDGILEVTVHMPDVTDQRHSIPVSRGEKAA
jgi:HSP20 family protein